MAKSVGVALDWTRGGPELLIALTAAPGGRSACSCRPSSATPSGRAGWSAASGCRRPGCSPRSSASRAGWSWTATRSWSPRATCLALGSGHAGGVRRSPDAGRPPPRPGRAPRCDVDFEYGVPDVAASRCATGCGRWAWRPRGDRRRPRRRARRAASAQLRAVVAAYLRRVRGAAVDADDVVVCAGLPPRAQPRAARRWPRRHHRVAGGGSRPDRPRRDRPAQRPAGRRRSRSTTHGPRRRRARRDRRPGRRGDAGAPVPDRGRARAAAPPGARRLGATASTAS